MLDESKMLGKIQEFPKQLEASWTSLWTKDLPLKSDKIRNVLIVGMGGSGIAGELARELTLEHALRPVYTWADYGLPSWVDDTTLVIAVSYSGNTEETINAVKTALERKAQALVVTSGGKLEALCKSNKLPWVLIDYKAPPRAALGWLYGLLLVILTKSGVINFKEETYFQALSELKKNVESKSFFSKAEQLALSINNKVPYVLAHSPLVSVARRWVNQFNENSKTFAAFGAVPEVCHNGIVGLEFAIPEKLSVLYLESKFGFSRNIIREKILQKLFMQKQISFIPLTVKSGNSLAEQWLLLYFGDLLSYYLAGVNGVDPSVIEPINFLKSELEKA